MSAAEVLNMAKAEGVTLELVGDRLTWKAEHQPPADLLDTIKTHRPAIIAELSAANDPPPDAPQHAHYSAATASPEWRQARDGYIAHLMTCRACHAPTGRHCAAGTELRAAYDATPWS